MTGVVVELAEIPVEIKNWTVITEPPALVDIPALVNAFATRVGVEQAVQVTTNCISTPFAGAATPWATVRIISSA